MKTQCQKIYST